MNLRISGRMRLSVLTGLLFISLAAAMTAGAQHAFPSSEGESARYSAVIQLPKAQISGICMLKYADGAIRGSLFNEFGLSALDFSYRPGQKKVRLHHVVKIMDKWYVRRVLRKDLARLMLTLQSGGTRYDNEQRKITYQFVPIADEVPE